MLCHQIPQYVFWSLVINSKVNSHFPCLMAKSIPINLHLPTSCLCPHIFMSCILNFYSGFALTHPWTFSICSSSCLICVNPSPCEYDLLSWIHYQFVPQRFLYPLSRWFLGKYDKDHLVVTTYLIPPYSLCSILIFLWSLIPIPILVPPWKSEFFFCQLKQSTLLL